MSRESASTAAAGWTPNNVQARVLEAVRARSGAEAAETLARSWADAGLEGATRRRRTDPLDRVTGDDLAGLMRAGRRPGYRGVLARRQLRALLTGRGAA